MYLVVPLAIVQLQSVSDTTDNKDMVTTPNSMEPSLEWLYNEVTECLSPPPSSYKASVSDHDTLSFNEAMNDRDNIEKWLKAANDEIQSLQKNGTWKEVPITEAKTQILPGTWVFGRKRTPDGTISKYKARYSV